jgi:hypothetical protein
MNKNIDTTLTNKLLENISGSLMKVENLREIKFWGKIFLNQKQIKFQMKDV